ncbi:MAG: dTDP-4-amino-4,6-dideoxygalactose transaminase [Candidatus Riflebacteria bacterium]|nr:dTDP-4-amino-4,6-dideoxygalactose transaminase [Candidatus Riflebacteria bacterium]
MSPNIPFNKPFIVGRELYYISQAVIEGHLSGDGKFSKLCQNWLETRLNTPKALLTHSCTAALEIAAILCDIKPGDEIIMPSFTFVSTANAFVLRGGVPVFVDIRSDTLNLDENLVSRAITSRTKVIVPVHYAGVPCDMGKLSKIASENGLLIVEDAAQGLLSQYKGKSLGTIGHLGCLSFHETKNIISGEGGAILINDEKLIERAEIIREKGTNREKFFRGDVDKYTWVDIGSSYLPSELIGAFLFAQLENSEKITLARTRSFQLYHELLKPLASTGKIRIPPIDDFPTSNGHIFYIITSSLDERTRLLDHLRKSGINGVFHYVPLHSSPAGQKFGRPNGSLRVTEEISERLIRLPLFYEITSEMIESVVKEIESFYN